jgi:hypothetical protein
VSSRGGAAADLDLAIDDLLADRDRPLPVETADLVTTARLLHDALPRYHPRFRFEEMLARRLSAARRASTAPITLSWRPAEAEAQVGAQAATLVRLPSVAAAETAPSSPRRRSLLAGGAIASGVSLAIPIAGAALVAWRRGRAAGGSL